MTPERWQQITGIFEDALLRESGERTSFLSEACAGDDELRREVEAMLASHEQASHFIEEPALTVAARQAGEGASLAGQTIAQYQVLSLLGAGGMGDVYLALDTKLGRKVALKLLPDYLASDARRARLFTREARAASALNHPNIITVYDIGQLEGRYYIAMEYVDGATLRELIHGDKAPLEKLLKYLQQVAEGLTKAHAEGIVHRDLKPDNIMVTRDGYAKVLDFGVAKLVEQVEPRGAGAASNVATGLRPPQSLSGMVMGTAGYMSPEQAQGRVREIDHRSDIFSFGCILYEVATGRKAFDGKDVLDSLHKIVHAPTPQIKDVNPNLPADLERIVRRCLAKDPEKRYHSLKDVAIELEELQQELRGEWEPAHLISLESARPGAVTGVATERTAPAAGSTTEWAAQPTNSAEYLVSEVKRHKAGVALVLAISVLAALAYFYFARGATAINSLAVLPLVNTSNDPETEYLSDGISESLINNLSQLPNLKVMSLNSVLRYKGRAADAQAVGRELGVEAVLTGRVTQRGDSLSINVELVRARDNTHIWGEQYNRKLSDLLAVQGEISREVLEKLRLRLTGEEEKRATRRYTENTEAYQLYLKGRYHWNRRTADDLWKGLEHFQRAIELDSNYALAYSGVADSYFALVFGGPFEPGSGRPITPDEARTKSLAAARRAVELDPTLSEAHTSLAAILAWFEWDNRGAEREYKRALELNPDYSVAHQWYGVLLGTMGRVDEGIAELKRAQQLDPASLAINKDLGRIYCMARRYDEGIEQLQKTIELDQNYSQAHIFLGQCYGQKGMYDEAIREMQKANGVRPQLARLYVMVGKRDEALKILAEMKERSKRQYVSPLAFANVYAALGDKEQAFASLEKAFAEHTPGLHNLKMNPMYDDLRSDPRFTDLLRRIGLPP